MSSLNTIAERTGVSVKTVSRVLRGGTKGLRRDAVERARVIFDIAEELGYRPNASAQAMQSGQFNAFGWIVGEDRTRSRIPESVLEGVQDGLREPDIHLVLSRIPDIRLSVAGEVPKLLRRLMVDGLFASYTHAMPAGLMELIHESRIPSIWFNIVRETDSVRPDDRQAGRLATEHLLRHGHRRIAFVNFEHDYDFVFSNQSHYSLSHRYEGYCDAMRSAGLAIQAVFARHRREEHVLPPPPIEFDWLDVCDRPTGIVSNSGWGFFDLTSRVVRRLGRRECLSIVTISSEVKQADSYVFDTVLLPEFEIGRTAADMLRLRVAQPAKPLPTAVLPCTLTSGFSVWRV